LRHGLLTTAEAALELAHGCVSCTIRNDLLVLLRQLHRRDDVERIVVHLAPWLEPEPICAAIDQVRIRVAPGYIDGPAARDVRIAAVLTCVDSERWLPQALGHEELDDGRTVAQVVVGQAEFADVLVLTRPDPVALAVLGRLAPRARITVGPDPVEMALAHLDPDARRGRSDNPHGPLLAGQPPLHADGAVQILEFGARRPFHPQRLHAAIDMLVEGVIRTRGRIWLANNYEQPDHAATQEAISDETRHRSRLPPRCLSRRHHQNDEKRLPAGPTFGAHADRRCRWCAHRAMRLLGGTGLSAHC
jgi:G3E family GTPase